MYLLVAHFLVFRRIFMPFQSKHSLEHAVGAKNYKNEEITYDDGDDNDVTYGSYAEPKREDDD
jgi:hypothetical protein